MDVAQVAFTWKEGSGFHGSNQTILFLHFSLLRCLPRIWLDIVWVEGTVVFWGRCVLHVCELGLYSQDGCTRVVTLLKTATVTSIWPGSTFWVIYDQPSSLLLHLAYGNDPRGVEGGAWGLGSGEHERHKGRCGLFLLSLIGQDLLSLTFCTPSLAFHMLMSTGPEEEMAGAEWRRTKTLLSLSFFFHVISPLFLASSPLNNLTDFGMKGSECLADGKGGDSVLAVTCARIKCAVAIS